MLGRAFAAGASAAFAKFGFASQPTLSSVGMAPPTPKGLPTAMRLPRPSALGVTGSPNSVQPPMLRSPKLSGLLPSTALTKNSPLLSGTAQPPPVDLSRLQMSKTPTEIQHDAMNQSQQQAQMAPASKLALHALCTTCRQSKHYGNCAKPAVTPPAGVPLKEANFNLGMLGNGSDTNTTDSDQPSTSPKYHSATSASALGQSEDSLNPSEQAKNGFRDVGLVNQLSNEDNHVTGALDKTADPWESRGPTVNPDEETLFHRVSPPLGQGTVGTQTTEKLFNQIDHPADAATSFETIT